MDSLNKLNPCQLHFANSETSYLLQTTLTLGGVGTAARMHLVLI